MCKFLYRNFELGTLNLGLFVTDIRYFFYCKFNVSDRGGFRAKTGASKIMDNCDKKLMDSQSRVLSLRSNLSLIL